METIRLESPAPDRGYTAQRVITFARRKIRTDRQSCNSMLNLLEMTFGLSRNIAAAVLFSEVVLRNVTKDKAEINWPGNGPCGDI
jgi:hypothetical protein